jgi:hypothetical protein
MNASKAVKLFLKHPVLTNVHINKYTLSVGSSYRMDC